MEQTSPRVNKEKLHLDLVRFFLSKDQTPPAWLSAHIENLSLNQYLAECFTLGKSPLEYIQHPSGILPDALREEVRSVMISMRAHILDISQGKVDMHTGLGLTEDINHLAALLGVTWDK